MATVFVRENGLMRQLPFAQFEEELRSGHISDSAQICFQPLTGARFYSVRSIPQLWDALDSPQAMIAQHLRHPPFPWFSVSLTLIVLVVTVIVSGDPNSKSAVFLLNDGVMGWEETFLKGKWWTPWTAQLLHVDQQHLFFNLAILAYCGWRVEQAIGWLGALQMATTAVFGATLLVCALGEGRVVGASMMAFGLWGGQIALGFRMGEAIPHHMMGRYGWGNLMIFIPLFIYCLLDPELSHLGHIGALSGGVISGLFFPASSIGHRQSLNWRKWVSLILSIGFGISTIIMAWIGSQSFWIDRELELKSADEIGVVVSLPKRVVQNVIEQGYVWHFPNQNTPIAFVVESWGENADIDEIKPLLPKYEWKIESDDLTFSMSSILSKHAVLGWRQQKGQRIITMGCVIEVGNKVMQGHCKRWMTSAVIHDPPALTRLYSAHQEQPTNRQITYELAFYLESLGHLSRADDHYSSLMNGADAWSGRR